MNIKQFLAVLLAALPLVGCCNYPVNFSAGEKTTTARAVLASSTAGEAYFQSGMARFKISPPLKCPASRRVFMAPVGEPDINGIIHYGAFVIRHGESGEHATVHWWKAAGNPPPLLGYHIVNPNGKRIEFTWINDRIIRFDFGDGRSMTIRLNEDDGPEVTEL